MFTHEGIRHGKYRRLLSDEDKMIIGLKEKVDNKLMYINKVGVTHLTENEYRAKKMYNELDVALFDKKAFMDRLKKLEDREPVTFKYSLNPD